MHSILWTTIALGLATVGGTPHAVDYREVRAVHDLAEIRLDRIADVPEESWLVARVEPGPNSGGIIAEGAHVNIDTGEVVVASDARFPVIESGTWKTIVELTASSTTSGEYRWEVPTPVSRHSVGIEDLYSPFVGGGSVLCRYVPDRASKSRFSPHFVIPRDWEPFVKPALETYIDERTSFDSAGEEPSRAVLRDLTTDENPLLGAMAFRELVAFGAVDGSFLTEAVSETRDYRQAALVYLMLTRIADDRAKDTDTAVSLAIQGAPSSRELKGIALGILTASLDRQSAAARARHRPLFDAVRRRQQAFGNLTDSDRYVLSILRTAGLE